MFVTRSFTLIILLFGMIGCTQPATSIEDEREQIKNTLTEMWNAIEKGDIDRYAKYIHPDFSQFGETDPVLREGKEAEVNGIREWLKVAKDVQTEMHEPIITIKENVAWITYYWSDKGLSEGTEFSSRGKSTRIFVKENDNWLCIHGHYTLLE